MLLNPFVDDCGNRHLALRSHHLDRLLIAHGERYGVHMMIAEMGAPLPNAPKSMNQRELISKEIEFDASYSSGGYQGCTNSWLS